MPKRSRKNTESSKRIDPLIVVALIGLLGTIIAALLASPLLERWLSTPPSSNDTPASISNTATQGTQTTGNIIRLNQTVSGTLYFDEAGVWIFSDGPATVTMILDVGPFGSALLIVRDPSGVDQAYVDEQSPGVARLVNFTIPTDGDYTILVRNAQNQQVDYTLTVQDALTPPPP
jgi:hypothetical protein